MLEKVRNKLESKWTIPGIWFILFLFEIGIIFGRGISSERFQILILMLVVIMYSYDAGKNRYCSC